MRVPTLRRLRAHLRLRCRGSHRGGGAELLHWVPAASSRGMHHAGINATAVIASLRLLIMCFTVARLATWRLSRTLPASLSGKPSRRCDIPRNVSLRAA